jgi:uncharacterized damage-inducible protein DinB
MPDWNSLARGFDYDLWANLRWRDWLVGKGWPEPDREIFIHILGAQEIWLTRFHGHSPSTIPTPEPEEATMRPIIEGWKKELNGRDEDVVIDYTRMNGEQLRAPLSEIARHVVNHGTYHRGELRGLCRARNDSSFPETDYLTFTQIEQPGT